MLLMTFCPFCTYLHKVDVLTASEINPVSLVGSVNVIMTVGAGTEKLRRCWHE